MPHNPILRRLITIPSVVVLFLLVTAFSPLLLVIGLVIDIWRSIDSGKPWMTLRSLAFLWIYLLGQLWALLGLLLSTPVPGETKQRITFELQGLWTKWNFNSMRRLFSLDVQVEGQDSAKRGPFILLSRHASMVDTMLPARFIANPFGIRLRYVLKRELLIDPTLDIGGNRLPNYFIDRAAANTSIELGAIRDLASDLSDDDAVLIYPEGTRFSIEKRDRYTARLADQPGAVGSVAAHLRQVLPPRPGGTLALLEAAPAADVVVLAHHGLGGLATVKDIWAGGLVGSKIRVAMWRIKRARIPRDRDDRIEWLYRLWASVDDWVVTQSAVPETAS